MNIFLPLIPFKQCSRKEKCVNALGSWLPATRDYWSFEKRGRFGLASVCKLCLCAYRKERYSKDKARIRKVADEWKKSHRKEYNAWRREHRRNNPEVRQKDAIWRQSHINQLHEQSKRRYWDNPEKYRAKKRKYHEAHRDEINARERKRWHDNHESALSNLRQWRENNPHKYKMYIHKRLAKRYGVSASLTAQQWSRALDYFDNKCAVCGAPENFWTVIGLDHWIPFAKNGLHEVGNAIPLCHARKGVPEGVVCCNNSKSDKDADQWLIARFGKRKATAILKRINAYFEWVRQQEST